MYMQGGATKSDSRVSISSTEEISDLYTYRLRSHDPHYDAQNARCQSVYFFRYDVFNMDAVLLLAEIRSTGGALPQARAWPRLWRARSPASPSRAPTSSASLLSERWFACPGLH